MGTTIWQRGAEQAQEDFCLKKLSDGTSGYEMLYAVRERLRTGYYNGEILDFTMQKDPRAGPFDLVDAYCFIRVWTEYKSGRMCFFSIPVGYVPAANADLKSNVSALETLNDFSVFVHNSPKDDDGSLSWDFDLGCTRVLYRDDSDEHEELKASIPPRSVPLEIGTTAGSRTLGHLRRERGLARWAYESTQIVVGIACRCCAMDLHVAEKEPRF